MKKRIQKIPKQANLKCPNCSQKSRIKLDNQLFSVQCPKCNFEIKTPMMKCCIVCAFTDKTCPSTLIREAKVKGLKLR